MKNTVQTAQFLLRLGLSFVFFYAVVGSFINPENWIGYFPQFLRQHLPSNLILILFSAYEFILGTWLLSGWKIFYPSILSALTISGIIIFNLNQMDVIFRDVAILFSAVSLAILTSDKK